MKGLIYKSNVPRCAWLFVLPILWRVLITHWTSISALSSETKICAYEFTKECTKETATTVHTSGSYAKLAPNSKRNRRWKCIILSTLGLQFDLLVLLSWFSWCTVYFVPWNYVIWWHFITKVLRYLIWLTVYLRSVWKRKG